mgnify:CR=1 FL=1
MTRFVIGVDFPIFGSIACGVIACRGKYTLSASVVSLKRKGAMGIVRRIFSSKALSGAELLMSMTESNVSCAG